jgi:hypothetical protein
MSVKTQALAICIARINEKIERIYHDNEGFDGEITAEQLADLALPRALAPKRPVSVAAPTSTSKSSGRKTAKCKYCESDAVKWTNDGGRWQLLNVDGSFHKCRSERPTAAPEERVSREHWHGLVRTFTDLKAKGVPRNEAADALEYDAEETPAPPSVIAKALNQVYGRVEQKQMGFAEALKAIGE